MGDEFIYSAEAANENNDTNSSDMQITYNSSEVTFFKGVRLSFFNAAAIHLNSLMYNLNGRVRLYVVLLSLIVNLIINSSINLFVKFNKT